MTFCGSAESGWFNPAWLSADATTDRILGCHIAGPDAGNLIHEAVIAMTTGATYTDIARTIHPTLAEGINAAAGGIHREVDA